MLFPHFFLRGDDFRTDYGRIGELRALLPPAVNVMALTATATKSSRAKILHSLRMVRPTMISLSPHKKNIVYTVCPKPELGEFVSSLVDCIKCFRTSMPRTIIFCRRYRECAEMYSIFEHSLHTEFTDPPNAPNVVKFRMVDMYTKCTEASIKKDIITEFSKPDGRLRIVIGTIAFGMGLDCPDVRQILHWGTLTTLSPTHKKLGGVAGMGIQPMLFYSTQRQRRK